MPKPTKRRRGGGGPVPPPPPPAPTRPPELSFSFRYFVDRPPFEVPTHSPNYLPALLERLRDLCSFTALELHTNRHQALRCHRIDWAGTTEPSGFAHLNATVREQATPYQFSLSSNEHGRVHGFFSGDVFFVVWLDPEHRLYA